MRDALLGRIEERERVLAEFLEAEKARLAAACHSLARAFARGGTLLAYGTGAARSDAAHVAVEFMHPIVVGKRALPALAPPNDVGGIARAGDVALTLAHGPEDDRVRAFREQARLQGLLTIAFTGGERVPADHAFAVPSADPYVVQEVQETAYHVLWELVHVFFEHPGLLDEQAPPHGAGHFAGTGEVCITCGDVAVAARVVRLDEGFALVEKDGLREQVAVDFVEGVDVGDVVLCHAGVALEKVS